LADEVGIKAHATNLTNKKQVRVVASGNYSNVLSFHKDVRNKDLRMFRDKPPSYSVTTLKDYEGPDIDWTSYNQQFMSAQLAKSVGFFSYLDEKLDAMHNDVNEGTTRNQNYDPTVNSLEKTS
jgi:acylphosphatase